MNVLYKAYLYLVTFYYAVLSPSFGGGRSDSQAFAAVFGSVIHALIAGVIVFNVEWARDLFGLAYHDDFGDAMLRAGLPVAIWVWLGFLHYPALQEMHRMEREGRVDRNFEAVIDGLANGTVSYEDRKRELAELKRIERESPNQYRMMILNAKMDLKRNGHHDSEFTVLNTEEFVNVEYRKLTKV